MEILDPQSSPIDPSRIEIPPPTARPISSDPKDQEAYRHASESRERELNVWWAYQLGRLPMDNWSFLVGSLASGLITQGGTAPEKAVEIAESLAALIMARRGEHERALARPGGLNQP